MLDLIEKKTPQGNDLRRPVHTPLVARHQQFNTPHTHHRTHHRAPHTAHAHMRTTGIMLTLDEQLWVPKGSDATFILACNKTHGMKQNANYAEVRTSNVRALISFSLS